MSPAARSSGRLAAARRSRRRCRLAQTRPEKPVRDPGGGGRLGCSSQFRRRWKMQCGGARWTRLAIRTLFLALLTAASAGLVGALEGHHHGVQDEMQQGPGLQGGVPLQFLPQAGWSPEKVHNSRATDQQQPRELHRQARSQTVVLPLSRGPLRVVPGRASQQFWSEAETGRWEPETFKVLYQELTSDVSYLGVGEWCGITGLFAAQRSKRAILVEPDPIALSDELRTNVDIFNAESRVAGARRVSIETRCVSAPEQQGTVTMVGNGSSTSSLVHGLSWLQGAPTFEATCMTLEDLITHHGLTGEIFIKMDIEGAESTVVPSLLSWLSRPTMKPKLFISFHAQATQAQKEEIAKVFNLYKHYAVLKVLPPLLPSCVCLPNCLTSLACNPSPNSRGRGGIDTLNPLLPQ